jgi:hypothetical protein
MRAVYSSQARSSTLSGTKKSELSSNTAPRGLAPAADMPRWRPAIDEFRCGCTHTRTV